MSTFTKAQLIARINQVTAINKYRISRDPDADGLAMDNELLAIALASLEAEAVYFVEIEDGQDINAGRIEGKNRPDLSLLPDGINHLYTAQPAPSVDEDLLHMAASAIDDLLSNKDRSGAGVWVDIPAKLRRAAMLHGAEPVTTDYKLPE
jgi:hypothetical protein